MAWSTSGRVFALCLVAAGATAGPSTGWEVPPEGSCSAAAKLRGWPLGADAPPFELRTGELIDGARMSLIQSYLPPPIWENRDRFFFEGMRLEVGPCFRDYAPPPDFAAATEKFKGKPALRDDGGLLDEVAGLPFAPDAFAADDPQAGAKWAWNFVSRWRAAGYRGRFRIVDLIGHGSAEAYEGEIWKRELGWRADRADDRYRVPGSDTFLWVAGGKFTEPTNARDFAWQQYRDVASATESARSDDLHMYIATMRKVDRTPAAGVDGIFVPSFAIGQSSIEPGPLSPFAAESTAVANANPESVRISPKRTGFEGLELRPQYYAFRALGTQDVLAPINAAKPAYPTDPARDFGPYGLSWASDRWDLRRALVLEARPREGVERGDPDVARSVFWLDLQTLYPLYYASFDAKGEPVDVGYYVGRWSEEPRVIVPVGQAFANLHLRASWRRESWELSSEPESDAKVRQAISLKNLNKGR